MKNFLSKVAGIGLATTMALGVQSSAQALKFQFTDYDPDPSQPYTASGFFDIDDTLGFIPGEVEFATELVDYEIRLFDNSTLIQTITPSNATTSVNSLVGVSVSPSTVDFSSAGGGDFIRDSSGVFANNFYVSSTLQQISTDGTLSSFETTSGTPTLTASASATAVPFGVSGDLSLLILGGLYGASRLRKTIIARKQVNNQSV